MACSRLFSFCIFLLISVGLAPLAQAVGDTPQGTVAFPSTLEINEKVEGFANGVASALFSDFEVTNVQLQRNAQGQLVNAFNQGTLAGTFNGVLSKDGVNSTITSDFSVEIGVEQEREVEYEIHVRANGQITEPRLFLLNYLQNTKDNCRRLSRDNSLFSRKNLCERLTENQTWTSLSAPQLGQLTGEALKQGLIEQIQTMRGRQLNVIREDLVAFLDRQIQVDTSRPNQTQINIDLSELSELFSEDARDFLNEYELRDYHYKGISIVVGDDEIVFDYFMVKLHVQSRFNLYMAALGELQSTLESQDIGESVGSDIRSGSGLKDSLVGNSTWGDYISAGKLVFIDGVDDSDSAPVSEETADELDELGLD